MDVKSVFVGALIALIACGGSYFFLPPFESTFAKSTTTPNVKFIKDQARLVVQEALRNCLNQAKAIEISSGYRLELKCKA